MVTDILIGLTAAATALVIIWAIGVAAYATAAVTVEQDGRHADTTTADGDPLYEGRHCAPDPEATTFRIEPPAALIRPYATAGGTR